MRSTLASFDSYFDDPTDPETPGPWHSLACPVRHLQRCGSDPVGTRQSQVASQPASRARKSAGATHRTSTRPQAPASASPRTVRPHGGRRAGAARCVRSGTAARRACRIGPARRKAGPLGSVPRFGAWQRDKTGWEQAGFRKIASFALRAGDEEAYSNSHVAWYAVARLLRGEMR